jgi:hypothetical protein
MKRDSDMRPQYDFSGAKRAKYAARFTEEERSELLHRSATLDGQYWLGHTLQRIQELEAVVVAYLTLGLNRTPEAAGIEAAALLDGRDPALFSRFVSALTQLKVNGRDVESRFKSVMSERSWLIHKGGFALVFEQSDATTISAAVQRLTEVAREANELREGLRANLEKQLSESGLTPEEVRKRTDEVIHHWLAA